MDTEIGSKQVGLVQEGWDKHVWIDVVALGSEYLIDDLNTGQKVVKMCEGPRSTRV